MEFTNGRKFRVIKAGASITGMVPVAPCVRQGFTKPLPVGTILTCIGEHWTGGDGVPVTMWTDEHGKNICDEPQFRPSTGGLWTRRPDESYLEEV